MAFDVTQRDCLAGNRKIFNTQILFDGPLRFKQLCVVHDVSGKQPLERAQRKRGEVKKRDEECLEDLKINCRIW